MEEPPHVHIVKDGNDAKVWLEDLVVAHVHGYDEREIRELVAVVAQNRDAWLGAWNEFFGL
ncbi:MAG: DUF4160 domain-containing protein [Bauldia litoralis]|uniref:DUF4160 domain-containing protein n=2 Tax=Hyphomicrobiales TaxID=356 RepID=UPI0032969028